MKLFFLSPVLAICCLVACANKGESTADEAGNRPHNCPPEPKGYLYDNDQQCFLVPAGHYASKVNMPCFWAGVLTIALPEIINHTPIPPKAVPFSGISNDGKTLIDHGVTSYYHLEGANNTDSFRIEFLNPDKEGCQGEQFVITGINEKGKPIRAQLHTEQYGEIKSSQDLNFQ